MRFGSKLYRQIVGIPMGNVIPWLLLLFIYQNKACQNYVTHEHVCLSIYKHSCCEYLIINQVVSSGKISNKWGHLLQPVAFGS